jgi:hypothetical protein
MAKPTWLGRNEMESKQWGRNASLLSFAALLRSLFLNHEMKSY